LLLAQLADFVQQGDQIGHFFFCQVIDLRPQEPDFFVPGVVLQLIVFQLGQLAFQQLDDGLPGPCAQLRLDLTFAGQTGRVQRLGVYRLPHQGQPAEADHQHPIEPETPSSRALHGFSPPTSSWRSIIS
jgi:hypothetical protein